MITISKNELCIHLRDNSPEELRHAAIRAINAAIRWSAQATDKRTGDADHLMLLADLQDALTDERFME